MLMATLIVSRLSRYLREEKTARMPHFLKKEQILAFFF